MKKLFTVLMISCFGIYGFAQERAVSPKQVRNQVALVVEAPLEAASQNNISEIPLKASSFFTINEVQVGITRYDNQANASIQNRIYVFDDGTIGATWAHGLDDAGAFSDRSTGYSYFDGNAWSEIPDSGIEDEKTGRPSYCPFGENGELVAAHTSGNGTKFSFRDTKGSGEWDSFLRSGPSGQEYILWNRTVTSGENHNRIHHFSLTLPSSHGGTPYDGVDGALLYSLSTDGGDSWDYENEMLDGMTSDEYVGFEGDNYAWADPKGDVLAFVVGDPSIDMFLMKSTDGGETFEQTIIWKNPYEFWEGEPTDTFYCVDGAQSVAIDDNGIVHVAFGINMSFTDDEGTYWFPFVDGIGYWNENMPTFSDNLNALSPYGDPGSELVENYNLIGWSQDVNGNGELDLITAEYGKYYLGLSSMPQIVIKENTVFIVYASMTETFDNGLKNFRHLWTRTSSDGGVTWGAFTDLSDDIVHMFDECVYPSCAANMDNSVFLVYQTDAEPGTAVWGGQHPYGENKILVMEFGNLTGVEDQGRMADYDVLQNYPNPANSSTLIGVNLSKKSTLNLKVLNLAGQVIYKKLIQNALPGMNKIVINLTDFSSGMYFYTVSVGGNYVTKKMIVE